jgi:hypothetical protein
MYLGDPWLGARVDLQRFMGTGDKAAIGVPVTPVEGQAPTFTAPPTRQPA